MGTNQTPEGVEKRGNSLRISFIYKGVRCRETLRITPTTANIRFAQQKRSTILLEITLGTFDYAAHFPESPNARLFSNPTGQLTVGELYIRWWPSKLTLRSNTQVAYQKTYRNYIEPYLARIRLMDLRLETLQAWQSTLATTITPNTANYARSVLVDLLNFAIHNGMLTTNPARALRALRQTAPVIEPFTDEEIKAIILQIPVTIRPMVIFELATGMRLGELFALRWEDCDMLKHRVFVQRTRSYKQEETGTKTHRNRYVDLSLDAQKALTAQKAATPDNPYVFPSPNTQHPWTETRFLRAWQRWLQQAGVHYRCPYTLRHTCASHWLARGLPPAYIAQQLGHNMQTLFKHYARWFPEQRPTLPTMGHLWDTGGSNHE